MTKIYDFNDLVFEPHFVAINGANWGKRYTDCKQARLSFENGYEISVLFGPMFYSNNRDTYEVAVLWHGALCSNAIITDYGFNNISSDKVSEIMKQIQELPNDDY